MKALLLIPILALPLAAQEYLGVKDFLTQHEVEVVREAQDPNDRIAAYMHFASLRLELVDQLLAKEQAGRGAKIHDNLEQYGRIIEAIDMVVDDALLRDLDVAETIATLVETEEAFFKRLETIEERAGDDLWRYEFVLEDALELTTDSLELSAADLGDRKREIIDSDEAEKAARERTMSDARRKDVEKVKDAQEQTEEKFESKRPSLLKAGETLEKVNDPDRTNPKRKKD